MNKMTFHPGRVSGTITLPSSKSQAHRALICAALAGDSRVERVDISNDISATVDALKSLGAELEFLPERRLCTVGAPVKRGIDAHRINCRESASALRFLIPIAAALGDHAVFDGEGRLPERTTTLYEPLLESRGVRLVYLQDGKYLPLEVSGSLNSGGDFMLRGDISSQFVTGLMLALVNIDGTSRIIPTTKLESRPYADMTADVLRAFGADVTSDGESYVLRGTPLCGREYTVEGDCSQAAFFVAAAAIGGEVKLDGVNPSTLQGDFRIFEIARGFGASVEVGGDYVKISRGSLHAQDVDAADIPDLVPAIAVIAAFAEGRSRIYNAGRLRLKESDRIASTAALLKSLGADVVETDDGLIINGRESLAGGEVKSYSDHRIAMAAAAATPGCKGDVTVDDIGCTDKSYPGFVDDWSSLIKK